MQEILDKAIEQYRRRVFLQGLSEDFRRLSEDKAAWNEYQREMSEWETTKADGLDKE